MARFMAHLVVKVSILPFGVHASFPSKWGISSANRSALKAIVLKAQCQNDVLEIAEGGFAE
jgi:hypothetical protein